MVTHLVLLAFSYNVIFLFAGTACLGLFLSSTFPSMLAHTEDILQYKGECTAEGEPLLWPLPALPVSCEAPGQWEQVLTQVAPTSTGSLSV